MAWTGWPSRITATVVPRPTTRTSTWSGRPCSTTTTRPPGWWPSPRWSSSSRSQGINSGTGTSTCSAATKSSQRWCWPISSRRARTPPSTPASPSRTGWTRSTPSTAPPCSCRTTPPSPAAWAPTSPAGPRTMNSWWRSTRAGATPWGASSRSGTPRTTQSKAASSATPWIPTAWLVASASSRAPTTTTPCRATCAWPKARPTSAPEGSRWW